MQRSREGPPPKLARGRATGASPSPQLCGGGGARGWLKRLYHWVLHWAETPYGTPALFLLAVAESSFFPIPPDVLLIALALGRPKKSFLFAAVCSIGSVLGGILGYCIGWFLWEQVHPFFVSYVFSQQVFDTVQDLYQTHAFWTVFTAGFTPIPY